MKFPTRKNDIVTLATQINSGLGTHTTEFPDPPFNAIGLGAAIGAMTTASQARQNADADLKTAVLAEKTALDGLVVEMRKILRLAEGQFPDAPDKLALLGWGPRSERSFLLPAQPKELVASRTSPGVIVLEWQLQRPNPGGTARYYRVERRQKSGEDWLDWMSDKNWSTTALTMVLTGQPERVELEYRVIAVNANGESLPGNTAAIVA